MFWIQTQNCVPHSLRLKPGRVSKGFSEGWYHQQRRVGGASGEWSRSLNLFVTLGLSSLQAAIPGHAGLVWVSRSSFISLEENKIKAIFKKKYLWSSCRGTVETNLTRNYEVVGSIPSLAQWVKDLALL